MRIKYIIFFAALAVTTFLQGQVTCNNLDLENANFQAWNGYFGCNDRAFNDYDIHFNNSCDAFSSNLDIKSSQINSLESQQSIVSNTFNNGVDPYVNAFSLQSPLGGNYIARVGDLYRNNIAGALTKSILVDSNNALLTMYYAIILEAPGHDPITDNPYFRIRLNDPQGKSVPCIEYTQDGDNNADGFQAYGCSFSGLNCNSDMGPEGRLSEIVYRDWTAISINLSDYIGQTVELEVSAGGCALTGHLGYAYFDAKCGKPEIIKSQDIVCMGNPATLTAPEGMESYEWRKDSPSGAVISTQNPFLAEEGGTFYCTMVPFSTASSKCPFTLSTSVTESSKLPTASFIFEDEPICEGTSVELESTSSIVQGGTIDKLLWNLSNGAVGEGSNFTYAFANAGTYSIQHLVESIEGCIDTISQEVEVFKTFNPTIDPIPTLCNDDASINAKANPSGGVWTNTSNQNGLINPANYSTDTTFTVTYTIGACANKVSANVSIKERKNPFFTAPEPLCSNAPAIFVKPLLTGGSWSGANIDRNGKFIPAIAGPGWHTITYQFAGSCSSSYTDSILVNPSKNAELPDYNPVCILNPAFDIPVIDKDGTWSGDVSTGNFNPNRGAGNYTIVYTFGGDCPSTDTTIITVTEKSDANFNLPAQVCADDERFAIAVVENGGAISGDGIVSTQQKIFDPKVAGPGVHNIQYLIAGACGDTVVKSIEVIERPNPDFTVPKVFCIADNDFQITAVQPGGNWQGDVSNTGVFSPSTLGPGTYTVRYSFNALCDTASEKTIEVIAQPDPFFTLPDTLCSDYAPINIIPNTDNGFWSSKAPNGVFNPNRTEGYHTINYSFTGTCAIDYSDSVFVKQNIDVQINGKTQYCLVEGSAQFTATPSGGTFIGNVIDNNGLVDFTSLSAGSYSFTYKVAGQCGDEKTFSFDLTDTPNPNFTGADTICSGASLTFVPAQQGGTWSGTGVDANGNFSSQSLASNQSYEITYAFAGACPSSAKKTIFVQAFDDASFSGPTSACTKEPAFTLSALNAGGTWGGIADVNGVVTPANLAPDSVYLATYSIGDRCPDVDSLYITIRDFYRTNFDAPDVLCRNTGEIQLIGEDRGGGWFGDGITSAIKGTFDPAKVNGDTAIIRYVFNGICGSETTDTIVIKDAVIPTLGTFDTYCWYADTTILPTVSPSNGVFIFQGDTTPTFSFNPKYFSAGTYTVQYGVLGDCPAFASQTFTIAQPVSFANIAISAPTCSDRCDAKLQINTNYASTSALNYFTTTLSDTLANSRNLTSLCPDNYTIVISEENGCSIDTSISILKPLPGEIFLSASPEFCGQKNGFIVLDSTKNIDDFGFLKLNGSLFKDSILNLSPGVYPIEYRSSQGCVVFDTIEVKPVAGPSLLVNYTIPTCFENNDASAFVENISGGKLPYSIKWNTGETKDSIVNLPAGNYTITVSDANNCAVTSGIVIPKPKKVSLNINLMDSNICIGDSVLLNAALSGTQSFNKLTINGKSYFENSKYIAAGNYNVYAITADKCYSDTISFTVGNLPQLAYSLQTDETIFCPNDVFKAKVNTMSSAGNISYTWENEPTSSVDNYTKTVVKSDDDKFIHVRVQDACLVSTDSVQLTVKNAPVLALNPFEKSGCEPLEVQFADSNDMDATFYLNGTLVARNTTQTLSAGIYTLQTILSNGTCYADTTIKNAVEVFKQPQISIISLPQQLTTLQNKGEFLAQSTPPLSNYNWLLIGKGQDTLLQSNTRELSYVFDTVEGNYKVELIGTTKDACTSNAIHFLEIIEEFHIFIPNAFTPNGDGDNEAFAVETFNINISEYQLDIVDRWGKTVFSTVDPDATWNGQFTNGNTAPIGIYNWRLKIIDDKSNYIMKSGHVSLIR